ncbi:hypothetical protein EV284_4148 [Streptomyces sp. BK022]|uniref:hypothetical protein n=1 Tax=Streptomyces sp. BK022 TaxID=2512123 RepID=UPI0010289721|nr:hypothetical protein [Streptomyces sp. BK022]RZU36653.1 hypothetical protein EV284_4148 [Streptomyces sp. BK022]
MVTVASPGRVSEPVLARNALAMMDDRALCALDVRLDYFEVQTRSGRGRGRLPVVTVKQVESLNDGYRRYLGLTSHQGSAAFIGGGLARLRSGSSLAGIGPEGRRELLAALVAEALDRAAQTSDAVLSPFLTATDLPAYLDAAPSATVREHGVWCTLEIDGAAGIEEFLQRLPAKRRRHWNRDIREAEELGLEHDVVPFSDEAVAEAAAGIASVSRRNGMDESPDIVRWRIGNYRRRPGKHFFVRTRWQGQAVTHMLCRMFDDTMDAHTLGIVDVPGLDRGAVYHFGCLLGPLRAAVERGAHRLELGIGHDSPKLRRGCTGEDTYFADLLPAR